MPTPPQIAAIGWYREEDYEEIIRISDDGDIFSPSYAAWLEAAEHAFERARNTPGIVPIKVYIYPKTFPIWCEANGMNVDKEARQAYGNFMAFDHARKIGLI